MNYMFYIYYILHRVTRINVAWNEVDAETFIRTVLQMGGKIDHVEPIYN